MWQKRYCVIQNGQLKLAHSPVSVIDFIYRMTKIYCSINQCGASVQYFAILHADKYCTISEKPI